MLYIFFSEVVVHHPQILNYKGRKLPATHTCIAATVYSVDFLQGGYWANPQILNYKGKKHPATHIYCCNNIHYRFLAGRLLSKPTDSELQRQETPSHTHIYYCNNIHYRFLAGGLLCTTHRFWITKEETHIPPPHKHCWSSLRCTFLPTRLLSTPTDSGLRRQETHSHPHIHWCNSVHCTFFAVRHCEHWRMLNCEGRE